MLRILDKSEHVLTLQNGSVDFWFSHIYMLFSYPLLMAWLGIVIINRFGIGWSFLFFPLAIGGFWLLLQWTWESNEVKTCSFSKALDKVTFKFKGLRPRTIDLPLSEIKGVEVRRRIGVAYGVALECHQLGLLMRSGKTVLLSEEYPTFQRIRLEEIANHIRDFLRINNR
ncbi:MAG: hypothetical protein LDL41_10700 [Coleofasciculus sp. S288]|nr:hypothetical protein [Coleofasciculus sp. S288]